MIGYLIISVLVGVFTIKSWIRKENYLSDVPCGDLEFYDTKFRLGFFNFIFFPSILIVYTYLLVVKLINLLIDKFYYKN